MIGRDYTISYWDGEGRDRSGNGSGIKSRNRSRIRSGNAVGNGEEHDGELGLETAADKEGHVTGSYNQLLSLIHI